MDNVCVVKRVIHSVEHFGTLARGAFVSNPCQHISCVHFSLSCEPEFLISTHRDEFNLNTLARPLDIEHAPYIPVAEVFMNGM